MSFKSVIIATLLAIGLTVAACKPAGTSTTTSTTPADSATTTSTPSTTTTNQ